METLVIVLTVLSTVCSCIPQLVKGKDMRLILLLLFLGNALTVVNYLLSGAYNGAVSCAVGALQTVINYFFQRKNKPLPKWLIAVYALMFIAANMLVFTRAADILAVLATLAFVMAISGMNGKQFRTWSFLNVGLWIVYDIVTNSYGPLATHIILVSMNILGMVMHDRKKKNS